MTPKPVTVEWLMEAVKFPHYERLGGGRSLLVRTRAPHLAQLAEFINEKLGDRFQARMEMWFGSFDRHIRGTRFRSPGKFREAMMLVVYERATGKPVLKHNPIEAYRENSEVCAWILREMHVEFSYF
jgi:hypothetical protein